MLLDIFSHTPMAFNPQCGMDLDSNTCTIEDVLSKTNWDDVSCPICLNSPHNCVLLQCASFGNGCRPFMCDTDHLHSNCLDRFKNASSKPSPSTSEADVTESENTESVASDDSSGLVCPLCRGKVSGWLIVDAARKHLDIKKRHCEEERCQFLGTYLELKKHAQMEHPHSRPTKIDPARQLDWENFQQSSEIIDVLSTIHAETPRGVVLGDYVIEYGDDSSGDEYEDFPGDDGNWWTSCILYQVFDNIRNSRNRRRSRIDARRGNRNSNHDSSRYHEGSSMYLEFSEYRTDETDDEFVSTSGASGSITSHRRSDKLCYIKMLFPLSWHSLLFLAIHVYGSYLLLCFCIGLRINFKSQRLFLLITQTHVFLLRELSFCNHSNKSWSFYL